LGHYYYSKGVMIWAIFINVGNLRHQEFSVTSNMFISINNFLLAM
jgi:hypothetical protein